MKTILFATVLALGFWGCKPNHQELAETGIESLSTPVTAEEIIVTDEIQPLKAVGMLSSATEYKQSFKIGGVIDQIYVDEGDQYRAGQVLARLEMKEISAQVKKAQEGVEKYERDAARVERLYADTVATLEQFQDIGTALELARADLEIAEYNQKYAQIIARQSGRVLRRLAEPGELVGPGTPVLFARCEGSAALVLKVGLADRDIVRVQIGDSARVAFDAWPEKTFEGEVRDIAPQADPMTGTFEVEIAVVTGNYPLRPGFIGQVELFPRNQQGFYKIPMEAIVEANDREVRIFMADTPTQTAREAILPLAQIHDEFVLVDTTNELPAGLLILAGSAFLSDQAPISIQ